MPYSVLVMLLFWMVLLLLPRPALAVVIPLLPKPTPNSVVVLAWPTRLRFLMVLLATGALALLAPFWPQMTALVVVALVWVSVMSRVAGAFERLELEPLMVTQFAPLRTISAVAE